VNHQRYTHGNLYEHTLQTLPQIMPEINGLKVNIYKHANAAKLSKI
jgi:hypothetical protein